MPWYEVKVTAVQIVAVEAQDAETAANIAFGESFGMDFSAEKECEYSASPFDETKLDSLIRHADLVLPFDCDI